MAPNHPALSSTTEILAELAQGRMIILIDEEDRENEGDLLLAADFITPEAINFMARYGRGLICLTLTEERCKKLNLAPMTLDNKSSMSTAFTVSIEAAHGVTTGISAQDRAVTIAAAVHKSAKPEDIVQPGHIFPIMARPGGVLVRAGHTEAGCDLTELAGLTPAAVICEIMREDGQMARLPDLIEFAQQHQLKIGSIVDLIQYRAASEKLVHAEYQKTVNTPAGEFKLTAFTDCTSGAVHLALVKGNISADKETLVRVHQPLSVLDFLDEDNFYGSFRLMDVMHAISRIGCGVILLMHHPESPSDVVDRLQETPQHVQRVQQQRRWDPRTHGIGAQILHELGVRRIRLIGSPMRIPSMIGFDLELCGFVSQMAALDSIEPEPEPELETEQVLVSLINERQERRQ